MKMNSKTLFSLLSTFMKNEITNFQVVSLPMQYPGCQRFFLRSFRCRSCLYCNPSEKPQGLVVRKQVNAG